MPNNSRFTRLTQRRLRRTHSRTKPDGGFPDDQALQQEMQQYVDQLGTLCRPAHFKAAPAGFAGVFLEPVRLAFRKRHGPGSKEYENTTLEYSGYLERTKSFVAARQIFCRALAMNPTTRALSLLALSAYGVKMMERGLAPSGLFSKFMPADYNRHHIVQKSAQPEDGRPINHLSNLVLINTGATGEWRADPKSHSYNPALDPNHSSYQPARAQRPDLNAHHFFHGALLVSQTDPTAGTPRNSVVYCPRPAFPVFPPIGRSNCPLRSREEIYARLEQLEPGITARLPKTFRNWADKLVAFSTACEHRPYRVPQLYHEATLGYTRIYEQSRLSRDAIAALSPAELQKLEVKNEKEQDRRRTQMALDQERLAASFLPLDAQVNGKKVAAILKSADLEGASIPRNPIPLAPPGWKPLKSYQQSFPSLAQVHQNMRQAGLAARIPIRTSAEKSAFLNTWRTLCFFARPFGRDK